MGNRKENLSMVHHIINVYSNSHRQAQIKRLFFYLSCCLSYVSVMLTVEMFQVYFKMILTYFFTFYLCNAKIMHFFIIILIHNL